MRHATLRAGLTVLALLAVPASTRLAMPCRMAAVGSMRAFSDWT